MDYNNTAGAYNSAYFASYALLYAPAVLLQSTSYNTSSPFDRHSFPEPATNGHDEPISLRVPSHHYASYSLTSPSPFRGFREDNDRDCKGFGMEVDECIGV